MVLFSEWHFLINKLYIEILPISIKSLIEDSLQNSRGILHISIFFYTLVALEPFILIGREGRMTMFSLSDLDKFAWAFFVILPIVSFIHAVGHHFFVWLFGGKGDLIVGKGKEIFCIGPIHIRLFYFIDAACHYKGIEKKKRWQRILIHGGGSLFNLLTVLVINFLIIQDILPRSSFFYQFAYFSFYYIFFALLPFDYGENAPSDGQAILLAWKKGR